MRVDILAETRDGCRYIYLEKIRLSEFCNQDEFLKEYSKKLRDQRLEKIGKQLEDARKVVGQLERLYDRMKKEEGND